MIRKDNVLEVEHLGGGKGTTYVHHIVSKEELLGHGRLYAKVVLPPGASVGCISMYMILSHIIF